MKKSDRTRFAHGFEAVEQTYRPESSGLCTVKLTDEAISELLVGVDRRTKEVRGIYRIGIDVFLLGSHDDLVKLKAFLLPHRPEDRLHAMKFDRTISRLENAILDSGPELLVN